MSRNNRTYHIPNALSLSRGMLSMVLFGLYEAGAVNWVLVSWATIVWTTDVLDGATARRGVQRTSRDGPILDPLMDDVALFVGFLILAAASVVPLWFVLVLVFARILFQMVRMLTLIQQGRFRPSIWITKLSGVTLAVGQCLLLVNVHAGNVPPLGPSVVNVTVAIMTVVLSASVYRFAIQGNASVFVGPLRP